MPSDLALKATSFPADKRSRLWSDLTRAYKRCTGYQRGTGRAIPLVLLDPAS